MMSSCWTRAPIVNDALIADDEAEPLEEPEETNNHDDDDYADDD